MRILLVDNYDSFTYNLYQYLGELSNTEPLVFRNDALTLEEIRGLAPTHLVLSPGPGSPERERDFGICASIIKEISHEVPTLGVCLGHQGIIHHLGGKVIRAPRIVHGKTSLVRHDGTGLFRGLPSPLEVMRYHSLLGEKESLPACLKIDAETEDGLIMGVSHRAWPLYGIQFHPESIGTPTGKQMLRNFLEVRPCTSKP